VHAAPKAAASAAAEDWVSPLTGEKIAPDKIQEHLRIGLLDPKWIEQRDRQIREKQHEEEVLARGTSIEQSLKKLAERRTDIFGLGAEETQIGKKVACCFVFVTLLHIVCIYQMYTSEQRIKWGVLCTGDR
jgi:splicing factor 3A subunit 1